jgi:ABC-2 type transport system permease protein
MKYIELYFQFLILQLKTIMEYKTDFVIGLLSVILGQVNTFLLTIMVFTQLDSLVGFSIYEIFLMYGFYTLVRGIDRFYNDNIWSFAWNKIRDGRFITILLRPINPIFYIVMERIEVGGLSEAIIGILIIIYSLRKLAIPIGIGEFFVLCLLVLCGLTVYFSIKLLCSAPAFWTTCCGEFMTAGVEIGNTAKYPIELYKNKAIKNILLFILPFPIAAYFPSIYCLEKVDNIRYLFGVSWMNVNHIVLYSVFMAIVLLFVSIKVWYIGLKHFEPTGT